MPSVTWDEYNVTIATLSWVLGFVPVFLRRPGWRWTHAIGLALLVSPFARMAVDVYLTIGLVGKGLVLRPVSEIALWASVADRLFWFAALPLVGLFLAHDMWTRPTRATGRDILAAHGMSPRSRSWGRDAARGLALLFVLTLAYLAAYGVSIFVPRSVAGGDESQYWRNVTIPLILMLSIVPGVTEELLFRGVLLSWLSKRLPFVAAAFLQALFFALIHAGYGTWTHLAAPFVFGLGMAWVARELGVWTTAVLHAEVNTVFFVITVWSDYVAKNGAPGAAALVALVLALAAAGGYALWTTRAEEHRILWRSLWAPFRRRRGIAEA